MFTQQRSSGEGKKKVQKSVYSRHYQKSQVLAKRDNQRNYQMLWSSGEQCMSGGYRERVVEISRLGPTIKAIQGPGEVSQNWA